MMYSAFVKDKETGEKRFIESDYPTRANFLNDLKANGYTVYRAEPKEVYDYILKNTNGSKTAWEIAKKLYKEGKPLTKEEYDKMKDEGYEVVNDKNIDAIKDNFTPPGAKEDVKELKEKHKEKGTSNKDDKNLLELANKLLGGNSQMLLKYNDLPYFDVLKDEDKATYRVYTDGSDKFEKIKDAVKDSPFKDPNYEENKALSEIDTNDNGKIEKDEMADFQKSLDDYASKNPKGRDDIPVTTRR